MLLSLSDLINFHSETSLMEFARFGDHGSRFVTKFREDSTTRTP